MQELHIWRESVQRPSSADSNDGRAARQNAVCNGKRNKSLSNQGHTRNQLRLRTNCNVAVGTVTCDCPDVSHCTGVVSCNRETSRFNLCHVILGFIRRTTQPITSPYGCIQSGPYRSSIAMKTRPCLASHVGFI
jgi:hypothetical protein